MFRSGVFLLLGMSAVLSASPVWSHDPRPADNSGSKFPPGYRPAIDLVLCLDTSNSMDGLILSAKAKLWDIVNDLARVRPSPTIRVALYSYGNDGYDRSNGWIRRELDLCTDLDEVYRKLNGLTTNGGTEFATRVARDAVIQQPWSADPKAMRLMFVCGNEPADQDRETPIAEVAAAAKRQGITINTIFCGSNSHRDSESWRLFASYAGGAYLHIDTNRPVVIPTTPYDAKINEWGQKLNSTYLPYGAKVVREEKVMNQTLQDANAAKLGAGVAAGRGAVKASAQYRNDAWDLCDRKKNDKNFDITKIPEAELPECLQKLPVDKRAAEIDKMIAERDRISKEISELNKKRMAYIADAQKTAKNPANPTLDAAFRKVLKDQVAERGLTLSDSP